MSKYLKKFSTHTEYETYVEDRQNLVLPNVSYCEDDRDVHYNPYVEPPFFCKLTLNDGSVVEIEDTDGRGRLTREMTEGFKSTCVGVEIGDLCTMVYSDVSESIFYEWSITSLTIGNNVNFIGELAANDCNELTSLIIPNSVTRIAYQCFYGCNGLTTLTIGNGITEIGDSSFCLCPSLTEIIIEAETPPTLRFDGDERPFNRTNN